MNKAVTTHETATGGESLIDEIIRLSDFTFDRLPMLDIIGDRLVENLSVAFPDLTDASCEISLLSLDYLPLGQIIEAFPTPIFLAVGTGSPFDGEILLAIDHVLLLTSIELMLGGTVKQLKQDNATGFTAIEKGFGERLAAAIFAELQGALSVVSRAELELDRVETDQDAAGIVKLSSLCARLKISVEIVGHTGVLEVIVPYDALEPIRPDLSRVFFGNRGQDQSVWKGSVSRQIERALANVEVVLAQEEIALQKIFSWQPGDTVNFDIKEGEPALLRCADEVLFKVSLGQRNNGFIAVQITEPLSDKKDQENDGSDN